MSEKETNIESINPKEDNGSDKIKSTFSSEATSMDIQDHKNGNKKRFFSTRLEMLSIFLLIEFKKS